MSQASGAAPSGRLLLAVDHGNGAGASVVLHTAQDSWLLRHESGVGAPSGDSPASEHASAGSSAAAQPTAGAPADAPVFKFGPVAAGWQQPVPPRAILGTSASSRLRRPVEMDRLASRLAAKSWNSWMDAHFVGASDPYDADARRRPDGGISRLPPGGGGAEMQPSSARAAQLALLGRRPHGARGAHSAGHPPNT